MRNRTPRRGNAMMLVMVSVVLFLALWSVTYRQTAAALRVETGQALRVQRDEGSIQALAKGVTLLETGLPPSNPYVAAVSISTSRGVQSFTVTFISEGGTNWAVTAAPTATGENPPLLPSTFAP